MQQWTVTAKNAVNGAKIQENVTGESSEQAKELFLAGRPGMSLEIIDVVPDAVAAVPSAEKKCPKCAEMVKVEAEVCRFCGHSFVVRIYEPKSDSRKFLELETQKKSVGLAVLLNLLLPGAGYMYCGRVFLGVIAFAFVLCMSVVTYGFAAIVLIPVVMIDGALSANRYNSKLAQQILAAD